MSAVLAQALELVLAPGEVPELEQVQVLEPEPERVLELAQVSEPGQV